MPQSMHDRVAELHNLAAHAHSVAATSHGKGDHLTAHELSKQAHEHSVKAHQLSEELVAEAAKPSKASGSTQVLPLIENRPRDIANLDGRLAPSDNDRSAT